ncbi:MAG: hypothetical protein FWH40_08740 [Coriobacteriia bacterium]|nr:hypothetical protein [Coriobacteriia bacterium]
MSITLKGQNAFILLRIVNTDRYEDRLIVETNLVETSHLLPKHQTGRQAEL